MNKCQQRFNVSQRLILVTAFTNNCDLNPTKIMEVAQQTGLSEKSVRSWFYKTRSDIRCERKKGTFFVNDQTGNAIISNIMNNTYGIIILIFIRILQSPHYSFLSTACMFHKYTQILLISCI